MSANKVNVKITSAVVVAGEIIRPGQGEDSIVEVLETEAKNLLNRGKAELLTSDDDDEKPLSEYTVPDLKALAKDYKIKGAANLSKDDLIAAIEAVENE